jgi:tetratricopeptide (TPR) repeat protein
VITRLAKIGELRVISRSSTLRYKTQRPGLAEIARDLGVSHLVEGTVQRVGDRVRINVQLIRAVNEDHLWAEIYDRNLTDIFAVQSELATAIAHSLRAKLSGREQQAVAEKPTSNLAAYDAYLRGVDFFTRPGQRPGDQRKATEAFEEAVRLDPQFALAWARLAEANASLYFLQFDATKARAEAARVAAENARRLAPASPDTLMAEAYYRYHVELDFSGARELFEKLRREMPSSSAAVEALARIARRQSRWKESIRLFEEAEKLNPRDAALFMDRCWTFSMVRDYAGTLQMIERAEAIAPGDADILQNKAYFYQWRGDLNKARAIIERIGDSPKHRDMLATQLVFERRYDEAARKVEEILASPEEPDEADRATMKEWLGSIRLYAGDIHGAEKIYLEAKPALEKLLPEQPMNRWLASSLSTVEAGLGNKAAALGIAQKGLQVAVASGDPINAPFLEENLASIEARVGEAEAAINRIERLLTRPYGAFPLTVARLRIDPNWDPLRSHPRFKALVDGPEPKTVYQ